MQVQIKAALWVLWQRLLFLGQTATSEGVDASITITIGRGDILHKFRGRQKVYSRQTNILPIYKRTSTLKDETYH